MFPPQQGTSLDLEALSGICGSISIACWIVVFSPQIIENFRRHSAEGLSVKFLVIWLAGDLFNILGAVLQGVLPTMIILALYYTLADVVLLAQVFYYRGFTMSDEVPPAKPHDSEAPLVNETSPLLQTTITSNGSLAPPAASSTRTRSTSPHDLARQTSPVSAHHLSPATPLLDAPNPAPSSSTTLPPKPPTTLLQTILFNTSAILIICASGILGWWLANNHHSHHPHHVRDSSPPPLEFDTPGQIFGYLCAALYLGSRVPQLLLNHRRKSTEGVSLLFFLFACVGNLTYDMSIFAYGPVCRVPHHCRPGEAAGLYRRYIAVNASWILGSLGTLVLDMGIFAQFFRYRKDDDEIER